MSEVKFEGVPLELDGNIYILPTLSVRQLKDMIANEKDKDFDSNSQEDMFIMFDKIMRYMTLALRRNYKDIAEDDFMNLLGDEFDYTSLTYLAELYNWISQGIKPDTKKKIAESQDQG